MLKRRIGFGIWSLFVILFFAGAKSFFSAVLLMGTGGILLFSLISVAKAKTKLQVRLLVPEEIKQKAKDAICLSLKNTGAFPVFSVKGIIHCSYEKKEVQISFSNAVKPYQEEKIHVPVASQYTGKLSVGVETVDIYDLIGLVSYSVPCRELTGKTQVLPEEVTKKDE